MSLSDDEQNQLRRIETFTAATDPDFARRLNMDAPNRLPRRPVRLYCWLLVIGGLMMITGPALAATSALSTSIGGPIAGTGCMLMMWAALRATPSHPFQH